ncbi:undecaprenyl/decaprenyl-phosphate alpha-N-acetylglucosaminyl 1-phosphate transferase [Polaribacter sp. BAL334]|uniref:glycosyltransferase family 4 protein n=1 Tax=Polaribacter sp. BAL334 TaxID=1708178 RepID=UPI0018D2225E|nr:MraY family glycosyltransferase [Polaribacter sp. BAL334]MBG7612802.1 undecaprenyl/decaprenyl-phosphate alpha-N-acetylglucosaminyl 1-phosphate transferase [Polaribacter sp. BAL334]
MNNLILSAVLSFLGSFVLVILLIPKISWIVTNRNLIHCPNERSSHINSIPTMGGVAFFLTIIFMLIILKEWDVNAISVNLTASLGLLFAIGLKDDLVISTARAKVGGEIIAILLVIFSESFKISSLHGFLGLYEIPSIVSYLAIIIMFLIIINSYNLIDGIDGLAAIMGIVVLSIFGFVFYTLQLNFYFLFSISLIGVLLAYLYYNLSKTKKVFMGDTGSLIIGFCIGFLCLRFLSLDFSLLKQNNLNPENSMILIIAVFFIPLFDTFRIIGVRLLNKKSVFKPDNNHIHHILINSGLTHFKSSLFLSFLNLLIAVFLIKLSTNFNSFWMLFIIFICTLILLRVFYLLKKNLGKMNSSRHLIAIIQFVF